MRNIAVGLTLVLALACGDSGSESSAGAGAATGGASAAGTAAAGTSAGAAAATGGTMPPVGVTGGTGAGGTGAGGTGAATGGTGAGGTGAATGGTGAGGTGAGAGGTGAGAGGTGAGAGGTGAGAGGTGGMGGPTVCSAPNPATSPGNTCPGGNPPALTATLVSGGFDAPIYVTHAPGDTTRLFVVERPGRIVIIDTDGSNEREFLDISGMVTSGTGSSETGLLGLAFHPDFPSDPRFYVNYTTSGAGGLTTRIGTYDVSASDDEQVEGGESELFSFGQPQPNHNGGMLAFGHDGCLYVGTGDGGGANDTFTMPCASGNGQCLDTPLGKILRIDVDAPDMAAPGNLDGGHRHIWDYGIRNAWRFSFDRDTGDLYIGDVGQGAIEEVDVAPRGVGNINWGWRIAEGSECRGGGGGCDMTGLEPPTDEYANAGTDDCVIGGYVYRGSAIPDLQGWYLYGDNGSNRIRSFVWDGAGRCGDNTAELTSDLSISGDLTSFGEDGNGELYMTTLTGNLYRIEAQ